MRHADLQEGRLYVVKHHRAGGGPARLIRRGQGMHIVVVPEDRAAEVQRWSVELRVPSRDIEREWTAEDDERKVQRERNRDRKAELQSWLDSWFADIEPEPLYRGAMLTRLPGEVKRVEDEQPTMLFFHGAEACQRVLAALKVTLGDPQQKQLTGGAP